MLDQVDGGRTNRDRLQSMLERAERKGRADVVAQLQAKLEVPPFPQALQYLWQHFQTLRRRKLPGYSGPNPIEWHDIHAYSRLTGARFAPWEVILITELDDVFLSSRLEAEKTKEGEGEGAGVDPDRVKSLLGNLAPRKTVVR